MAGRLASALDSQLVKVVVTTHNRRSWAAGAIDSVLAQTHQPVHVVIVDDASGDGTAELARSYAAAEPQRVTAIIKPENRGVADSIRLGLEAPPDAPYVAILNDDDRWHPSKLERQLRLFERDPALGLVFCEAEILDQNNRRTGERFSDLFGHFVSRDFEDVLRGNHACASTLLLTRELAAIAARSLPERLLVWDYYLVLLGAGYSSVAMVDEPLALYRVTETGLHAQDSRMWRDTTLARQELFARHPRLVERVGGPRAARRRVALLTREVALMQLRRVDLREYGWHSLELIRQRSPRHAVWLLIHTVRTLLPSAASDEANGPISREVKAAVRGWLACMSRLRPA